MVIPSETSAIYHQARYTRELLWSQWRPETGADTMFLLLLLTRISCLGSQPGRSGQCGLSQLEEEISGHNTNPLHLRLRDLMVRYPGDMFSRLEGSWCEDVSDNLVLIVLHDK